MKLSELEKTGKIDDHVTEFVYVVAYNIADVQKSDRELILSRIKTKYKNKYVELSETAYAIKSMWPPEDMRDALLEDITLKTGGRLTVVRVSKPFVAVNNPDAQEFLSDL